MPVFVCKRATAVYGICGALRAKSRPGEPNCWHTVITLHGHRALPVSARTPTSCINKVAKPTPGVTTSNLLGHRDAKLLPSGLERFRNPSLVLSRGAASRLGQAQRDSKLSFEPLMHATARFQMACVHIFPKEGCASELDWL